MTDQPINVEVNKKISWLELIPKLLAVFVPLGIGLYFLFQLYDLINDNAKQLEGIKQELKDVKAELKDKVDKHEFDDLNEKVTRQYSIFNERMVKDVDPMKTYIEYHKGWLEGSKLKQ